MVDLIKVYNDFNQDYAELKELVLNKTDSELIFDLAKAYQQTYPKITNLNHFLINCLLKSRG